MFPRPPTQNDYYLFAPGAPRSDGGSRSHFAPRDQADAAAGGPASIVGQLRDGLSLLLGMTVVAGASFFALLLVVSVVSHDGRALAAGVSATPVAAAAPLKPPSR